MATATQYDLPMIRAFDGALMRLESLACGKSKDAKQAAIFVAEIREFYPVEVAAVDRVRDLEGRYHAGPLAGPLAGDLGLEQYVRGCLALELSAEALDAGVRPEVVSFYVGPDRWGARDGKRISLGPTVE